MQANQLLRERSYPIGVSARPNGGPIRTLRPAIRPKPASACTNAERGSGVVFIERKEHADVPDAVALLRARRERP